MFEMIIGEEAPRGGEEGGGGSKPSASPYTAHYRASASSSRLYTKSVAGSEIKDEPPDFARPSPHVSMHVRVYIFMISSPYRDGVKEALL